MPPVFKVDLVGFVDEQNVSLASSYFLGLVDADKLNHVLPELIRCVALVVEVGVAAASRPAAGCSLSTNR